MLSVASVILFPVLSPHHLLVITSLFHLVPFIDHPLCARRCLRHLPCLCVLVGSSPQPCELGDDRHVLDENIDADRVKSLCMVT